MAKVRIQAGIGSADEGLPHHTLGSKKPKDDGAVALLARVLEREGFLGWYQVKSNGTNLRKSSIN